MQTFTKLRPTFTQLNKTSQTYEIAHNFTQLYTTLQNLAILDKHTELYKTCEHFYKNTKQLHKNSTNITN